MSKIILTEQEKEIFYTNAQKIYDWIKQNICPFIKETINIDYGDKYVSPRTFNSTTDYHLNVYGEIQSVYSEADYIYASYRSGFETSLAKTIQNRSEDGLELRIIPLVTQWKSIKEILLYEKEKQIKKYDCLNNFNV